MFLVPLVLLALGFVAFSVLGLAGFGPLTDERRTDRDGLLRAVGPAIGLLMGLGLLALIAIGSLLLVGASGDDARDEQGRSSAPTAASAASTTSTSTPNVAPARTRRRTAALGPEVVIEADDGDTFPKSYDVADRLRPESVIRLHARGFEPFARAIAAQCAASITSRCGNEIPVQFDAAGEARFQYLVSTDFLADQPVLGRCRAGTAPCTIEVRSVGNGGDDTRGEIQTIFGDALPPAGRVTVIPATGLSLDGRQVTVRVRNYPPGVTVTAMLCAAPEAIGPSCGAPGPLAPLVVGRDGTGTTKLVIEPGPVGTGRASCSRGDDCGVSVASDDVFARAPVVPISFAAPPGADYDPTRLALGLGIGALLLVIATVLIGRTDWAPVGEAAAPEIDDAEYADLDAIIAALPPEEDDLVSTR